MQMHTIICPICGNEEIAFVSETHKCIGARMFQLVLVLTAIVITLYLGKLKYIGGIALAVTIPILIIQGYIYCIESRSHVQCICKDCGYVWLHT